MPTPPPEPVLTPNSHELWTEEGLVTLTRYEVDNILVALCLNYASAAPRRIHIAKLLAMWTAIFDTPGQRWNTTRKVLEATLSEIGDFGDSVRDSAPTSFRIYVNLFNKLNVRSGVPPARMLPTTTQPTVEKKGRKHHRG